MSECTVHFLHTIADRAPVKVNKTATLNLTPKTASGSPMQIGPEPSACLGLFFGIQNCLHITVRDGLLLLLFKLIFFTKIQRHQVARAGSKQPGQGPTSIP